ncbi:MAG: tRNA-modifying protein YgfZ [Gaiellaceae bacterium]|jgi:folate-binding protein YgfZ|nr:tRNA-modifying protein YgfZ [Gaiellaceae bacterium]
MQSVTSPAVARRHRAFVRVAGPDAADYLQRMVSNDVEALAVGEGCEALLLTAKARVIAPLRILRRADDDFLVLTEPELGETVRRELVRTRFAAKAEIEPEEHESWLVLGGEEIVGERPPGEEVGDEELERWRIESAIPRWGREIDDRILPAEAGLDETHISFSKGCYPGQEPIARQRYRGKVNRKLRVLEIEGEAEPGDELLFEEKKVGRITSAVPGVALGYVRVEVPEDAELRLAEKTGSARLR